MTTIRFLVPLLAGILGGALLGHTRSCETGGCPLTATPWRGAIYGGVIGLLVALAWAGEGPA
jgi:hypothetical protein